MSSEKDILLRLEQKIDQLNQRVENLEKTVEGEAKNLFSIFTDSADEWIRELKAEGVDLHVFMNNLKPFIAELLIHVQDGSFETLMRSGILDKSSVETVGALGQALVATKYSDQKMGPIRAIMALNDPDVQKTVGFAVRLTKAFGNYLNTNQIPLKKDCKG